MATVWSVLILIGMALVVAHLASSTKLLSSNETDLIDRTYTTQVKRSSDT